MRLGINAKIYLGGGLWTTEGSVMNELSVNPTWEKGPADSKESRVKRSMKTMLGLTISGTMKKKPGDAFYEAVMDALVSDGTLNVLILDGAKDEDGSRGWRCDCQVFEGTEDQGANSTMYVSVSFEPTDSDTPPQAVYVDGSSLTYSTPGVDGATFT